MKEIFIKDEFIRLDSALKYVGIVGTGGQAKIIIQEGLVKVNDNICTQRGKKLHSGDKIEFEKNIFVIKNEC
ncbi:MAG: RNA-binding S4 domain-containing protein [Acutalibacteraceae bacterium]